MSDAFLRNHPATRTYNTSRKFQVDLRREIDNQISHYQNLHQITPDYNISKRQAYLLEE
jgi:hypothetical protein